MKLERQAFSNRQAQFKKRMAAHTAVGRTCTGTNGDSIPTATVCDRCTHSERKTRISMDRRLHLFPAVASGPNLAVQETALNLTRQGSHSALDGCHPHVRPHACLERCPLYSCQGPRWGLPGVVPFVQQRDCKGGTSLPPPSANERPPRDLRAVEWRAEGYKLVRPCTLGGHVGGGSSGACPGTLIGMELLYITFINLCRLPDHFPVTQVPDPAEIHTGQHRREAGHGVKPA